MPCRKVQLVKGELYHIYSKSITEFKIFNTENDYERMKGEFIFYSATKPPCKFSHFMNVAKMREVRIMPHNDLSDRIIDVMAYCIMPSHIHLILKERKEGGIVKFTASILKSYSQYFNKKYGRKGPLWESRFNNVLIKTDEQFIHLTRYIHLNPVTAYIVNNPIEWKHSSFREYVGAINDEDRMCFFSEYLDMDPAAYKEFVNSQIDYQRKLALLKK